VALLIYISSFIWDGLVKDNEMGGAYDIIETLVGENEGRRLVR
jgi:hypothetical protein